jgi:hypothetical protein
MDPEAVFSIFLARHWSDRGEIRSSLHGFRKAMQTAFLYIIHAFREGTIYDTLLPRRVLIIGRRRLPHDVNRSAGNLKFEPIARFNAGLPT